MVEELRRGRVLREAGRKGLLRRTRRREHLFDVDEALLDLAGVQRVETARGRLLGSGPADETAAEAGRFDLDDLLRLAAVAVRLGTAGGSGGQLVRVEGADRLWRRDELEVLQVAAG